MNIAFYSGASGLRAYQQDMDTIAHNIANVNTSGYKPLTSVFADLLYSRMAVNSEEDFLTGHGVKVADTDLVFQQGPILTTGNDLDFAIIGSGFFAVESADGEALQYARNGAFAISMEEGTGYLVTTDGYYVLDAEGQRIELEPMSEENSTFNLSTLTERIGVYQFSNPFGLEPVPGGRFVPTEISGEAEASAEVAEGQEAPYRLISRALEQSAVDLAHEMVMVIQTQKAFQFSARLVQTADQLEEIVNNLR